MKNGGKIFKDFWGIILGGSSGFGFASVKKLAAEGMHIAVLYRETAVAEKLLKETFRTIAEECKVIILPLNINALEESGRQSFISHFNQINNKKNCIKLLLHSIARGNLKPLVKDENSSENFISAEDIQFTSYAMGTSLLDWARLLLDNDLFCSDARIIGLTSEGANKYWESYSAVSIAKASLQSLSTYMAVEFGRFGIKTNLIQAGITNTPSLQKIQGSEKLISFAQQVNPLGRITAAEDVANAVYLLCTNEAAWINGALLHVDGGEHCR